MMMIPEGLGAFLGRLGANVVVARNAVEGVEAVKTNRPKLVLCDIKMPGRDGFAVLRKIRAQKPADEIIFAQCMHR